MLKAAALHIVVAKGIHDTSAVLYESAVCVGINAQSGQRNHDLCSGFRVGSVHRVEAAVRVLQPGEQLKRLIYCCLDLGIGCIIRSKSGQRHTGHIGVRNSTGQCPAAVGKLLFQDRPDQLLPGHISPGGDLITAGVKSDQRPNGTIDALLIEIGHIVQTH